ncbi:HTH-type transcriptional repressor ComR [Enhygromyxa salina]|uniref:HTH-type transcriptional repressor ComR n=1 Tax=Enhygromyxa salina TaxID=215803 RepID=A0A2S9XXL6_9BACT|nr:TetR/AcrR family transcriptional regulator [Enhygromyxa salina]PRP97617.1 HTH-type transcriptional repressor ComR [Enhygromyxa salina]
MRLLTDWVARRESVPVMPRAKTFDPDVALDRAVELFWRCGYDGASMVKLLEFMGISRQSLYDTFGDKHRLYLAAVDRYRAKLRVQLKEMLATEESGVAGIRAGFEAVMRVVVEDPEHRSCLMANAALELGQRDPEVRARVAEHLRDIEELFYGALERAIAAGEVPEGRGARSLARFLTNSIHGVGVMARGGLEEGVLRDTVDTTLSLLAA